MAAQTRQATDSSYTESRIFGVSEDTILEALPGVLSATLGAPIENPLPGCYTAHIEGMPARELIVRVEQEPDGTRVRLDVRPWQDTRNQALVILAAVLVLPVFIWLLWTAVRSIFAPRPAPQPPEVLAHGIFRGISKALAPTGGTGYRVASKSDAHLSREEQEEEEVSDPKLRRG